MTWTMKCTQCGTDLGGLKNKITSITIRPRGDEEDRSYFLCKECDSYSVWICIEDFFTDKHTLFAIGPISRKEGDRIAEKIGMCSSPNDISCRCPVHKEMESLTY